MWGDDVVDEVAGGSSMSLLILMRVCFGYSGKRYFPSRVLPIYFLKTLHS